MSSKILQIIEDRYIDEDKLCNVLLTRFGQGNYRLLVSIQMLKYSDLY